LSLCQLRWGNPNKTCEAIVDISAEVGRSKKDTEPLLMDQLRWGDPNKIREAFVDVSA
jgi:hypothetical protein